MRLDKLVYSIREAVREFSDDSEISDRYIMYLLDVQRAPLIQQKLNKVINAIPKSAVQSLCLEMENVSRYSCNVEIACDELRRTKKPLPKMFSTNKGVSLTRVASQDKLQIPFRIIDISLVPFVQYSNFKNKIYTFLDEENYLYLYSVNDAYKLIDCVTIEGIFESPQELETYSKCCECDNSSNSCYTMDTNYPTPADLIKSIRESVIKDILVTERTKEDVTNDSADD